VVTLVVTGGSLTQRPQRSLHCLRVEVTWQIKEDLNLNLQTFGKTVKFYLDNPALLHMYVIYTRCTSASTFFGSSITFSIASCFGPQPTELVYVASLQAWYLQLQVSAVAFPNQLPVCNNPFSTQPPRSFIQNPSGEASSTGHVVKLASPEIIAVRDKNNLGKKIYPNIFHLPEYDR